MVIKDAKGMYIIQVDKINRIVYEYIEGHFEKYDYLRYHNDYMENILPIIGKHPWAKCVDLKRYKISDITEEMCMHNNWENENGLAVLIAIVDNSIVKLQFKKKSNPSILIVQSLEEAKKHLKFMGFLT